MKRAVQAFEKAREDDPQNIVLLSTEGLVLCRLARYKEAEKIFNLALSLDPDNGQLLTEKARVLATTGRHEEAQEIFGHASAHSRTSMNPTTYADYL